MSYVFLTNLSIYILVDIVLAVNYVDNDVT